MNKSIIDIRLEKNGVDVVMKLKVAEELEHFFQAAGDDAKETSKVWLDEQGNGLKFYKKNEKMSNKVNGVQVIDNFGNGLYENGMINVALLRTCGAANGITIKTNDLLSYEEMKTYIEELAVWSRGFYENVLRPAGVSATIGFEV